MRSKLVDAEEGAAAKAKLKRKARKPTGAGALEEIKNLDYVLWMMVCIGLGYFLPENIPDGITRFLVLLLDQGSSGAMGALYLSTVLNVWVRWDILHRLWNDAQLGAKHSGLWSAWFENYQNHVLCKSMIFFKYLHF
jgi:hypothetical protein